MENFWDSSVWGTFILFSAIFGSLLLANVLKKSIPFLGKSLIPTSVLAGVILLVIAEIYKAFTDELFFNAGMFGGNGMAVLEVITYHCLALGFIASAFKTTKNKMNKKRTEEIFDSGVTTVATYLIQAIFGIGITVIAAMVITGFPSYAGILLPFGYGQGTGQALNYGNIYETEYGFIGGRSFGLTIAALGFLSASIGGVIHLNIMRKKGKIKIQKRGEEHFETSDIQENGEIPMQESVDKITIQVCFVAIAYFVAYLMMLGLGEILPGMKSTIYGFNFLLGVISATLIKLGLNFLQNKKIMKKRYTNNFLMTRVSNFFFDIMVVAGIAAINLGALQNYWGVIIIVAVVGLFITYAYNRIIAKTLFKEYQEEQFLAMYGMLTGTASTGVILLREIDEDFKTPAQDNLIYQTFPAIVFGFPMMTLATFAPKEPYWTLAILIAFFFVMNIILFRRKIFRFKKKNKKGESSPKDE